VDQPAGEAEEAQYMFIINYYKFIWNTKISKINYLWSTKIESSIKVIKVAQCSFYDIIYM